MACLPLCMDYFPFSRCPGAVPALSVLMLPSHLLLCMVDVLLTGGDWIAPSSVPVDPLVWWVFPHLFHEHACQSWILSPIVSWWSHTVYLCRSWSLLPVRLKQAGIHGFFCLGGCFFILPSFVLCIPSGLPVSVPLSWLEEVGSWWSCVPLSLQWCLFACCMIWCSNLFPLGIYRVLVLVC